MMQDSELQLEIAKTTFKQTSERLDNKIDQLKENERKNDETIKLIKAEKYALTSLEESGKGSLIDPADMQSIVETTRQFYVDCVKVGSKRPANIQDDPDYKKATQMDVLTCLGDIEIVIEKTIGRLKAFTAKDPETFEASKKKVRTLNKKLKQ